MQSIEAHLKPLVFVAKVLSLWPVGEKPWDFLWGFPFLVAYSYAVYGNRISKNIHYDNHSPANFLGDEVFNYACFSSYYFLVAYNMLKKTEIQELIEEISRFEQEQLGVVVERDDISAKILSFFVLLIAVVLKDFFVYLNHLYLATILYVSGFIAPIYVNIFNIFCVRNILAFIRKFYKNLNELLGDPGQITYVVANHYELTRLVRKAHDVFQGPVVTYSILMFIVSTNFVYYILVTAIAFMNLEDYSLPLAVNLAFWIFQLGFNLFLLLRAWKLMEIEVR